MIVLENHPAVDEMPNNPQITELKRKYQFKNCWIKCLIPQCSQLFRSKKERLVHFNQFHKEARPFVCFCGKNYKKFKNLNYNF